MFVDKSFEAHAGDWSFVCDVTVAILLKYNTYTTKLSLYVRNSN